MEEVDLEKLEKAKEEILPWNLQKKCSPCQHLDFSLGRPIADSDLQSCMVKSMCCFMHYVCRELLYSSNQKLIQHLTVIIAFLLALLVSNRNPVELPQANKAGFFASTQSVSRNPRQDSCGAAETR